MIYLTCVSTDLLFSPQPVPNEVLHDKKLSRDAMGLNLSTLAEVASSYSQVPLY